MRHSIQPGIESKLSSFNRAAITKGSREDLGGFDSFYEEVVGIADRFEIPFVHMIMVYFLSVLASFSKLFFDR